MNNSPEFLCGVIEGFYGRPWPQETRLAYADYLAEAGLNTCLYAPKSDTILRREWPQHWPGEQWRELRDLAGVYRDRGIKWGVGLSPLELYQDYSKPRRDQLRRKVDYLGELGAPILAILFDDMPGDMDALASRQGEIVNDVSDWAPGVRLLVCPTYYSYDPVLEQFFGRKPVDYWAQLGRELPARADIFWTGNNVCSDSVAATDIAGINDQLGRCVTLWDNYPVNDGEQRSNFLYLNALGDRSPELRPLLRGHLCNPMNQGLLSLPALGGLAALYGTGAFDDQTLCRMLGPGTWDRLSRDGEAFQHQGLSGLGQTRCRELAAVYGSLPGRAAREVTEWLQGDYTFDPACLTD